MSGGKARLDLGSDFRIKGEGCLSCTPMGLQEDNVRAMQTGTGPGLTVGLLSRPGLSPNTTALLGRTTAREAETPTDSARRNPAWAKWTPAWQQPWEPGGRAWPPWEGPPDSGAFGP